VSYEYASDVISVTTEEYEPGDDVEISKGEMSNVGPGAVLLYIDKFVETNTENYSLKQVANNLVRSFGELEEGGATDKSFGIAYVETHTEGYPAELHDDVKRFYYVSSDTISATTEDYTAGDDVEVSKGEIEFAGLDDVLPGLDHAKAEIEKYSLKQVANNFVRNFGDVQQAQTLPEGWFIHRAQSVESSVETKPIELETVQHLELEIAKTSAEVELADIDLLSQQNLTIYARHHTAYLDIKQHLIKAVVNSELKLPHKVLDSEVHNQIVAGHIEKSIKFIKTDLEIKQHKIKTTKNVEIIIEYKELSSNIRNQQIKTTTNIWLSVDKFEGSSQTYPLRDIIDIQNISLKIPHRVVEHAYNRMGFNEVVMFIPPVTSEVEVSKLDLKAMYNALMIIEHQKAHTVNNIWKFVTHYEGELSSKVFESNVYNQRLLLIYRFRGQLSLNRVPVNVHTPNLYSGWDYAHVPEGPWEMV